MLLDPSPVCLYVYCLSCMPVCRVCNVGVLWPNGWMDQDDIGMEVGLDPGHIVLDGDPAPPPKKKRTAPPNFWPMSVVDKRLDGSRCHLV